MRESSGSAVKQEAVDKLKERLAKIAQHIYVARRLGDVPAPVELTG